MSNLLKIFNDHLVEFFDDLAIVFNGDIDLLTARNFIINYRKINPKSIIVAWKWYV